MSYLNDWLHKNKVKRAEQKNELQLVSSSGLQHSAQVNNEFRMQELEIADKIANLRYKISINDTDVQQRYLELERRRDELDRDKAKFRLALDQQRQAMDMERDQFYFEQERQNKNLENEHIVRMAELHLKKMDLEQNHYQELARLDIQREQQQIERLKIEDNKAERLLQMLRDETNSTNEMKHSEKIREQELAAKQLELELAAIRLYSADMQEAELAKFRNKIQERMNGFGAKANNGILGEY